MHGCPSSGERNGRSPLDLARLHAIPGAARGLGTPGTNGPLRGEVTQVIASTAADLETKSPGKLAGKIVLFGEARLPEPSDKPLFTRDDAADLDNRIPPLTNLLAIPSCAGAEMSATLPVSNGLDQIFQGKNTWRPCWISHACQAMMAPSRCKPVEPKKVTRQVDRLSPASTLAVGGSRPCQPPAGKKRTGGSGNECGSQVLRR